MILCIYLCTHYPVLTKLPMHNCLLPILCCCISYHAQLTVYTSVTCHCLNKFICTQHFIFIIRLVYCKFFLKETCLLIILLFLIYHIPTILIISFNFSYKAALFLISFFISVHLIVLQVQSSIFLAIFACPLLDLLFYV